MRGPVGFNPRGPLTERRGRGCAIRWSKQP